MYTIINDAYSIYCRFPEKQNIVPGTPEKVKNG